MPLTFHNLNPGPADGTNILLGKICSRLGGLTQPGDSDNDLLAKILTQLLSIDGSAIDLTGNVTIGGDLTVGGDSIFTGDLNLTGDSIFTGLVTINNNFVVGLTGKIKVTDTGGAGDPSIWGLSTLNAGVLGESTGNAGVRGNSTNNSGVLGVSQNQTGVQGIAGNGVGMYGTATSGVGVHGESGTGTAIVGVITGAATALLSLLNGVTEKLQVTILGMIKCVGVVSTPQTLTIAAAATTPDFSTGTHFRATLGDATTTINNPTNPTNGQRVVFELIQDNAGNRLLALGNKFTLGTDITAVTLSTGANKRDFLTTIYNSTADLHYVVAFVKGY